MAEMLLVNPRRRKRRSGGRKRRKMTAKQLKYFGPRRNPRRRKTRRRSTAVALAAPVRHRRRRRHSVGYRRNPRRMARYSPRNAFSVRGISNMLMPAGVGAVGALGVDMAMGYATPYLPPMLTSGIGLAVAKIGGAIGVGYLAGMAMGKSFGDQATAGALVVTLYGLIKPIVASSVPGLPGISGFGGMGWVSPAMVTGVGSYDGTYSGALSGLGYYTGERESDYIRSYQ